MTNKTCGECKFHGVDCTIVPTAKACEQFEPKVITNGDVIRQMSNEELSELLTNPPCFVCSKGNAAGECADTWDCKSAILERLNAPAESEGER